MNVCIYTKSEFSEADGEHILQNFLGARWVSHEISCNEAQSLFGKTIDSALEEGLRQFRNLLGTKGGRGGEGPDVKNVKDSEGNTYHVLPGGVPHLAEPIIKTRELENGVHEVQAKLGDIKQLGWAIAKLKSQFPGATFDIDEIKGGMKAESGYLNDRVGMRAGIGGRDYFRGLLKSVFNLLGVNNPSVALMPCFDGVRDYVLRGSGDDKNHIRWLATADKLPVVDLGPVDHFVCIYSCGGNVDGIVQFFGGISHGVRLTDCYDGPEFSYGYQVNPFRNSEPPETRAPAFDPGSFPRFEDGFDAPGPDVWTVYGARVSQLMTTYYDIASEAEISRIVDRILMPHVGEELSQARVDELINEVLKFIVSRVRKD
jgi:hypothetical protein